MGSRLSAATPGWRHLVCPVLRVARPVTLSSMRLSRGAENGQRSDNAGTGAPSRATRRLGRPVQGVGTALACGVHQIWWKTGKTERETHGMRMEGEAGGCGDGHGCCLEYGAAAPLVHPTSA